MKIIIYNVWHHKLHSELINEVPEDQRHQLVLYGVNENIAKEIPNLEDPNFKGFEILFEYKLPIYEPRWQARKYCQTTSMIHLYKNNIAIDKNLDYIGWTQYDFKINGNIFSRIQNDILNNPNKKIIFHVLTLPINNVLPNLNSWWGDVLTHYNEFFHKNFTWEEILQNPRISQRVPMTHTFVIPVQMFQKMMSWMTVYLEKIEETGYVYDISQAEYAERIHGLFLALECENDDTIMLPCSMEDKHDIYHEIWENYKRKI